MSPVRFGALDALRLLLGAVMVVSALQYFLPSLVTFWPAYQWQDPMSVRLMAEFDRSAMSGAAFARWAGVKYPTFANWLQQRRKQAEAAPAAGVVVPPPSAPPATAAAVAWAEVMVETRPSALAKAGESPLCLQLPGGARLQLDGTRESLRQAAALLRELERNAGGATC